jgi:hypothetical protein
VGAGGHLVVLGLLGGLDPVGSGDAQVDDEGEDSGQENRTGRDNAESEATGMAACERWSPMDASRVRVRM